MARKEGERKTEERRERGKEIKEIKYTGRKSKEWLYFFTRGRKKSSKKNKRNASHNETRSMMTRGGDNDNVRSREK